MLWTDDAQQGGRGQCFGLYRANCGYDFDRATQAIKNADVELVSFGQLFISNPGLVERFKTGAELTAVDQAALYGGDEKGYTDYSFL